MFSYRATICDQTANLFVIMVFEFLLSRSRGRENSCNGGLRFNRKLGFSSRYRIKTNQLVVTKIGIRGYVGNIMLGKKFGVRGGSGGFSAHA